MSRDPFSWKQSSPSEARDVYEPGSGLESTIARELVQSFLKTPRPGSYALDDESRSLVETNTSIDGQSLVDEIFWHLARSEEGAHQKAAPYLFNPLIEILYAKRENNFYFDHTKLPVSISGSLGLNLKGISQNPLRLSYRFTARENFPPSVGTGASHCEVYVDGVASTVGKDAKDSSFYMLTPPSWLGEEVIRNSTFYLGGVEDVTNVSLRSNMVMEMRYYEMDVVGSFGERKVKCITSFNTDGNLLFLPDGEGGWEEYRPSLK